MFPGIRGLKKSGSQQLATPSFENVILVLVTYFPDDLFVQRAHSAAKQFKRVVLVDNSESGQDQLLQLKSDRFEIIFNGENLGLGHALNTACIRALELGFDWVITLDQDTELLPDFACVMIKGWRASSPGTALFGSNYYDEPRLAFKVPRSNVIASYQQTTVITSGCLTSLTVWSAIGKFREEYFIDSIDHEFCLRARQAGFSVAISSEARMKHSIGDQYECAGCFARFAPGRHSIWRNYTNARNSFRTVIDYASREPVWCAKRIFGLVYELFAIILLEPDKLPRLRAFFLGLIHGCRSNLGRGPLQF